MKAFKEGKKYFGRSMCDQECVIRIQILKRTKSFVEIKLLDRWPIDQRKFKVKTSYNVEYIQLGNYSLAPIISADRLV